MWAWRLQSAETGSPMELRTSNAGLRTKQAGGRAGPLRPAQLSRTARNATESVKVAGMATSNVALKIPGGAVGRHPPGPPENGGRMEMPLVCRGGWEWTVDSQLIRRRSRRERPTSGFFTSMLDVHRACAPQRKEAGLWPASLVFGLRMCGLSRD